MFNKKKTKQIDFGKIEEELIIQMHINIGKDNLDQLVESIEQLHVKYVIHINKPSKQFLDHSYFFIEILESMKQNEISNISESTYKQLENSHFPDELTNQLLLEYSGTTTINKTISFLNKIISYDY